jgi:hypothetical protein
VSGGSRCRPWVQTQVLPKKKNSEVLRNSSIRPWKGQLGEVSDLSCYALCLNWRRVCGEVLSLILCFTELRKEVLSLCTSYPTSIIRGSTIVVWGLKSEVLSFSKGWIQIWWCMMLMQIWRSSLRKRMWNGTGKWSPGPRRCCASEGPWRGLFSFLASPSQLPRPAV